MRIAVSGSHGTGKSTLIGAFVDRCPQYVYEPEAFETLADDIDLTAPEGPGAEGLQALLEYTVATMAGHSAGASVVYERSPVDYLAYAVASRRTWPGGMAARFLKVQLPVVRRCLRQLDLIALLPVSATSPAQGRGGEGAGFRKRVDDRLRRLLIDDDHDLFGDAAGPRVVELSPRPERQLAELLRLAGTGGAISSEDSRASTRRVAKG